MNIMNVMNITKHNYVNIILKIIRHMNYVTHAYYFKYVTHDYYYRRNVAYEYYETREYFCVILCNIKYSVTYEYQVKH